MNKNVELLGRISEELAEIKVWIRVSALPVIRKAALENLRGSIDKLVYELSDGTRSTREIASEVTTAKKSIAHTTVANMWKRWAAIGLVVPSARIGRYKKVTSLESLGIEIPKIPTKTGEVGKEAPSKEEMG